jgi:hypothetical protein
MRKEGSGGYPKGISTRQSRLLTQNDLYQILKVGSLIFNEKSLRSLCSHLVRF